MLDYVLLMKWLGVVVVAAPALMVLILGGATILKYPLGERATARLIQAAIVSGLLAAVAILTLMLILGTRHVPIEVGNWVIIKDHYHFKVKFVFDRLSVPFAILSFVLSGTIGAFATRYMHRERGYNRFFVLYAVFVLGMVMASLSGTIETLFAGWELVGLSSALLVAYYQERSGPARNGLWVWVVYRISDAALLLAAVVLHHMSGEGDFHGLVGVMWPEGQANLSGQQALLVGLLLLLAAAGKSGLIPFSGWLPRAMEGPTPSSAVFYGALSVHLGAFLLLRAGPIIECSPALCAIIVVLGLSTALYAYLAGSVQTDIKAALSFACLSQVGIIVAEIGFGLRYIALIHILGHACLRTLQFIRAPTLLHDYHTLENAIGDHLPHKPPLWKRLAGIRVRTFLYRFALERGYLDSWLVNYIVSPFIRVFRWCDSMERRWTDFLSGEASRESNQVKPYFGSIEEMS
jgi:NAD(P)H-quinone oxidoreductase subunit 5